jgi:hypothetical protein
MDYIVSKENNFGENELIKNKKNSFLFLETP